MDYICRVETDCFYLNFIMMILEWCQQYALDISPFEVGAWVVHQLAVSCAIDYVLKSDEMPNILNTWAIKPNLLITEHISKSVRKKDGSVVRYSMGRVRVVFEWWALRYKENPPDRGVRTCEGRWYWFQVSQPHMIDLHCNRESTTSGAR